MYVCTSYLGVLVMIATNGQPGLLGDSENRTPAA